MLNPLESYLPTADVRARRQVLIEAPAEVVWRTCEQFDLQSVPLVRATFWLRAKLLRASTAERWPSSGLLADLSAMGWGVLHAEPPRTFIAGAVCQPWLADVEFRPLGADAFTRFDEPGWVRIAWTLEVQSLAPNRVLLASETRAHATDDEARRRFKSYWRWARFGIVGIRWLILPAIRRRAEARFRSQPSPSSSHSNGA